MNPKASSQTTPAEIVRAAALTRTLAVLGGIAVIVISGPAQAVVKFCNSTGSNLTVAIAYSPKDAPGTSTGGDLGVTAEGW